MVSINNIFFHPQDHIEREDEEALEDIHEFVTQDNIEHFVPEHHSSAGESSEMTKHESLEIKEEAALSFGLNTMGMALGLINVDEGIESIKKASKKKDTNEFVNSFFKSFKGLFEMIEKGFSSSKSFIEGSHLISLNSTSSIVMGSTITAGASGASLALLAITLSSVFEKLSFAKKYQALLEKGIKDPVKTQDAIEALQGELFITDHEKQGLFDALFKKATTFDRCKSFMMELFFKDPIMQKCKMALLDPLHHDLQHLASIVKTKPLVLGMHVLKTKYQRLPLTLSKEDHIACEKIVSYVFSEALDQLAKKKSATFTKVFGEDIKESLQEITHDPSLSFSKSKEILVKASQNLSRELERSFIKLLGALLVATTTVIAQIATQGALYLVETALCLAISACTFISEIYALVKCLKSDKLPMSEKIKTSILSVLMISLITVSSVILRATLSPIATGILTVAWLLMSCYTVYLWIAKKQIHMKPASSLTQKEPLRPPSLDIVDKLS
jgi:hypothetical protein